MSIIHSSAMSKMEVSIEINHPDSIFTNGETIIGSINIHCSSTITVSKITATLIGESTSTLTGTAGFLMNRKEEEKHRLVHEKQVIIPYYREIADLRRESLKLGSGSHSFRFALEVPWTPKCCACPRVPLNSPTSSLEEEKKTREPLDIPPAMTDQVKGGDISYRIDIAVTTMRNMFKSTTRKSANINIWPIDTQSRSVVTMQPQTFSSTKSMEASIPGPPASFQTYESTQRFYVNPTIDLPAHILITAGFLPNFNLTRDRNRNIPMHLSVKMLHPYPHDLYLQSFQILLVGYTNIQAGAATSGQRSCWTIQSLSNLGMKIFEGSKNEESGTYSEVDPKLWDGKRIPTDAVPTFESCNLARRYELELLMGFQCRGSRDQPGRLLIVQLRIPVRLSSGILSDRRLDGTVNNEIPDALLDDVEENKALDDGVANWLEHHTHLERDLQKRDSSESFPSPPTYDEAIRLAMNKRLSEEKSLSIGTWR